MSSECAENDGKQWDYMCPQFCDFNATETTDQLKEIDHFFEVDHELEEENSIYGEEVVPISQTPVIGCKSQSNVKQMNGLNEVNDGFKYETPPQNKENIEDDDNNDVFYSTKKYLSVEKKYKLRSTPMRTLQYNGVTPLRETRISSKKKKKNTKSNSEMKKLREESLFTMKRLLLALPDESDLSPPNVEVPQSEVLIEDKIETRVDVYEVANNEVMADQQNEQLIENESKEVKNQFESENENCLQTEPEDNAVTNKRESYVIERVQKTVIVISPVKSSNTSASTRKKFSNSIRRKGTPIKKSALNSGRKVSSQSIVSRLYSTAKKSQNEYKPMAELIREFETQPRSYDRSRPSDRIGCCQRSRSSSVSSLTRPKSPKLHSIHRHRPTPRQTEDIIASQIKKYSFKANPIRKKLFDANFASNNPTVKSSKAPTKAIPMSFQTEKRLEFWANKHSTDDKPEGDHKFKANPMPAFKNPKVLPTKPEKKATTLKPFSFDDRIQHLVTKKRTQSEDNTKRDIPRNTFRF